MTEDAAGHGGGHAVPDDDGIDVIATLLLKVRAESDRSDLLRRGSSRR